MPGLVPDVGDSAAAAKKKKKKFLALMELTFY